MAQRPYIVGIAGGSASGKTSFLTDLREGFPNRSIGVLSQDNYYRPREHQLCDDQGEINFDLPTSIHREAFAGDLKRLMAGESIERQEYGFNNPEHTPQKVRVEPAPVIIMEGLFVFHYDEIRKLLDLKVYIDAREEVKLQRRILRDSLERGYSEETVRYQWQNHVMPSYNQFLRPHRDTADIIITNNTHYHKGLAVLKNHIAVILNRQKEQQPTSTAIRSDQ